MYNNYEVKSIDPLKLPEVCKLFGCDWLSMYVVKIIVAMLLNLNIEKFNGNVVELSKAAIMLAARLSTQYYCLYGEKGFGGLDIVEPVVKTCLVDSLDNPDDAETAFVFKREILTQYLDFFDVNLNDVELSLVLDGFIVFDDELPTVGVNEYILVRDIGISEDFD